MDEFNSTICVVMIGRLEIRVCESQLWVVVDSKREESRSGPARVFTAQPIDIA